MKGNNQHVKSFIRAGVLCYVCTKAVPTRRDAYGCLCKRCFDQTEAALVKIQLPDMQKESV